MVAQTQSDYAMRCTRWIPRGVAIVCLNVLLGTVWARDPFLPIGYQYAEPEKKETNVVTSAEASVAQIKAQEKSKAELEKIKDRDWADAQKRLHVDGFVRSESDAQNRELDFVMINRTLYAPGMVLTLTNQTVVFTWVVEIPNYRQVSFKRVNAVRLDSTGAAVQK